MKKLLVVIFFFLLAQKGYSDSAKLVDSCYVPDSATAMALDFVRVTSKQGDHFNASAVLEPADNLAIHIGQKYFLTNVGEPSPDGEPDSFFSYANNELSVPDMRESEFVSHNVTLQLISSSTLEFVVTRFTSFIADCFGNVTVHIKAGLQDDAGAAIAIGPQGPQGEVGPAGPQGEPGPACCGTTGQVGSQGAAGPAGPQGEVGPAGPQGEPGPACCNSGGQEGPQGVAGPQGDTGPAGPQGDTGVQGHTGPIGPQGVAGVAGPQGEPGPACCNSGGQEGPQGVAGPQGDTGPAGPQGIPGIAGATGSQGLQGETGPAGPSGEGSGTPGPQGDTGPAGPQGLAGVAGPQGDTGSAGPQGDTGPAGAQGPQGFMGIAGPQGATGLQGIQGIQGAQGIQGTAATLEFAHFFALMPGDNSATVGAGTAVQFPQNGPLSGAEISRINASQFNLTDIGVYEIYWQVSASEAGQLVLAINGGEVDYTVAGRATGTSQITNQVLVRTTSVNSILTIQNPVGNSPALTITPLAGGTHPVSATLIIKQIQ